MMRFLLPCLLVLAFPFTAFAIEAPAAQAAIGNDQVLRGHFVQESQSKDANPLQLSGHFVVAPARGLIWGVEKPFPTSTIITPKASVQDLGMMTIRLSIKNLQHLYTMIEGALTGDWSGLETDYIVTPSTSGDHWQMLLTPRRPGKSALAYTSITVSGKRFVENIVLMKANGSSDAFDFSDEVLKPGPITAAEEAAFSKAGF